MTQTREERAAYLKQWRLDNPGYMQRWWASRPGKRAIDRKAWATANPDRVRVTDVRRKYHLEPEEHLALYTGFCAGCGEPMEFVGSVIDHDHSCCPETGKSCGECIRGLLHPQCNVAIGMAQESPARLRALADYLEKWQSNG
jgi:hypothetical protein